MEKAREAGPVHVGYQFWEKLEVDDILKKAELCEKTRLLTLTMAVNRLIFPSSEYKMPGWVNSTALSDILSTDLESLNDEALYRNMDKLYPGRGIIEKSSPLFSVVSPPRYQRCTLRGFFEVVPLRLPLMCHNGY